MILYMIRHGESSANANGTHSGWSCVHLTEKGEAQAIAARKNVRDLTIDRLYVSDVYRTQQTADLIFPGMARTFIPLAREINNTPLDGKNKEQLTKLYGDVYLKGRERFDHSPLGIGCESLAHMHTRAKAFLKWAEKNEPNENICVVSHAGFIVAVAGCVLGVGAHSRALACDNASLSAFEFKNGAWRLKLWNLQPEEP